MKVRVFVRTNKIGSDCEDFIDLPDGDYEELDGFERDTAIEEDVKDVVNQMYEWGWEVVDD